MTPAARLLEWAGSLPFARPAGVILHVSRCGSTLLANVLRTGPRVVMLSEARPIGLLLRPRIFRESSIPEREWHDARKTFLDAVTTIYSRGADGGPSQLVIKCHPVNLLQIRWIRQAWPDVPCIVVIRDPVEVMASNLARPSGWLRGRSDAATAGEVFGWPEHSVERMTVEEYCARGIGRFLESAREVIDGTCKVIDYRNIGAYIHEVADFFHIKMPAPESASFRQAFLAYSKDPEREWTFESDRNRNTSEATEPVLQAVQEWAQRPYESLKATESW